MSVAVSAVRWPPTRQSGPLVDAAGDFTGRVVLDGLSSDTAYVYWVRFTATGDAVVSEAGQFRTAPPDDAVRPLGLVWWGDLAGQGYCRDPERGYAIFGQMARLGPDLAIANGDSVYEFVAGPASAITLLPGPLSRAFGPIELYARGQRADPARPSFLNFGHLRIAADGLLTVEIRDAEGAVVPDDRGRPGALTLTPAR